MEEIVFNGNDGVRIMLKNQALPPFSIFFHLLLLENCGSACVSLLQVSGVTVCLTHYNYLQVRFGEQLFTSTLQVPVDLRSLVEIDSQGVLALNGKTQPCGFPLVLQEKLGFGLVVGSPGFKGLLTVPTLRDGTIPVQSSEDFTWNYSEFPGIHPLQDLSQLLNWTACDDYNVPRFPAPAAPEGRLTLVCHDMCHNYKEDVLPTSKPFSYRFLHWDKTHVFVYFSHTLVTVPPPGWTDSAHLNGALSLGTFITEPGAGETINQEVLNQPEAVASQLVRLMQHYKFDGYLLNIEADVESSEKLLEWIQLLRDKATREVGPQARILWYDSVDMTGKVHWQSCLNEHNEAYFSAAHGIFLDYHWEIDWPAKSATLAGPRRLQVFTGIDVYGRGTYGGGQHRCVDAVKIISETSIALFGQAWTYESQSGYIRESFLTSEKMVWGHSVKVLADMFGVRDSDRASESSDMTLRNWELCTRSIHDEVWIEGRVSPQRFKVTEDKSLASGYMLTSSFKWSRRRILIPLPEGYMKIRGQVLISGSSYGSADHFELTLEVLDEDQHVLETLSTGVQDTEKDWRMHALESSVRNGKFAGWSEAGVDGKFWHGHFGAKFTGTAVMVFLDEDSMDSRLPNNLIPEKINSWFNEGQGPALFRHGELLHEGQWSSLSDCDNLPVFATLMKTELVQAPYHGTTSLHLAVSGDYTLFHCSINTESGYILMVVSRGNPVISLVGEGDVDMSRISIEKKSDWEVRSWMVESTAPITSVVARIDQDSYIGGLHLYPKRYLSLHWELTLESVHTFWSLESVKQEKQLSSLILHWTVSGEVELIRHYDIYIDEVWVGRAYALKHIQPNLPLSGRITVSVVAETLWGSQAASASSVLEVNSSNP